MYHRKCVDGLGVSHTLGWTERFYSERNFGWSRKFI